MAKYRVSWQEIVSYSVEVEAANEDDAYNEATDRDHAELKTDSDFVTDSLKIETV